MKPKLKMKMKAKAAAPSAPIIKKAPAPKAAPKAGGSAVAGGSMKRPRSSGKVTKKVKKDDSDTESFGDDSEMSGGDADSVDDAPVGTLYSPPLHACESIVNSASFA